MMSIVGVALGASTRDPRDMPNACAIRYATPSVGFAWLRSIWLSIDRVTPQAADNCSSVHPRFLRNSRTRSQRCELIGSGSTTGAVAVRVMVVDVVGAAPFPPLRPFFDSLDV